MLEHYEFTGPGVRKQHLKQLMFPTTRGKNAYNILHLYQLFTK